MSALIESQDEIDIKPACQQLELSRATFYRRIKPPAEKYGPPKPRPKPARSLSPDEQEEVLGLLHSDRFVDQAPAQVVAKLLEEGEYFCSERTMYRVLAANGEVKERRNQRKHPSYARPELLAKAPNQVWSWDVTKLKGAAKGQYFSLYVIIDIFSRYIVGCFLSKRATKSA